MYKKILALVCLTLSIVLFCMAVSATEAETTYIDAIYVSENAAEGGTGAIDAPVATLAEAYSLLGNNGTIYLMDMVSVSSTSGDCFIAPAHTGKITITSADGYDGKLDFTGIEHFHFGGDTELNNIGIVANEVVITADNHTVTMGEGLEMSSPSADIYRGGHIYCGAKIHFAAYAPYEVANIACEAAGGRLNVYSGEYWSVSAWYGDTVTMTGGETQILLDTRNDTDSIWLRYLCPGMYSSAIENSLTCSGSTVTIIVNSGVNTLDAYRFTKNSFSGSMTVNWLLHNSAQGSSYAFVAKDFYPADNATCTLNVYTDQSNVAAKDCANLLMRGASVDYLGDNIGDKPLSTYEHTHEMYTEQDGRIHCVICEYEQCRHLTTIDVVTTPATCKKYGVISTYCDDVCKELLYNSEGTELDPNNHSGNEFDYHYNQNFDYMMYRCRGCYSSIKVAYRDEIGNHIIIGNGGINYDGGNLPTSDGSPCHFATYMDALKYIKVAYNLLDDLTIEFRGDVEIPTVIDLPVFAGGIHITGSENARLIFACYTKRIRANNDMVIDNVKFAEYVDDYTGIVVCAQNHKLVMGEGITTQNTVETVTIGDTSITLDDTDLYVIGGFPGSNAYDQVIDSDITVRSGDYRYVGGWNFNASTNDGKAKMTIGKTNPNDVLSIEYLCPFSRGDGYITKQAETTMIIDGDVSVARFYVTTLNLATAEIPYVINIVLKGNVTGTYDIRATTNNEFYPNTIVNVYTDNRVNTAVADSTKFVGASSDVTLYNIGATVNSYSYEDYCSTVLGGHVDEDANTFCDECGYSMSTTE